MTASATVDGSRGVFTVAAADDYARAELEAVFLADADVLVDYFSNLVPEGATWERWTSLRVGADRYIHVLSVPPSPADITWRFYYQLGAATPVALGSSVSTGFGASPFEPVRLEIQAEGSSPTTLRGRAWRPGIDAIPVYTELTDSTGPQTSGGFITAVEVPSGTPTNLPITFYTDNLIITNLQTPATNELDATMPVTSGMSATMTVPVSLSGTITARATLVGNFTLGGPALGGTIAAQSAMSAILSNPGLPQPPLGGTIAAQSAMSAQLTIPVDEPPSLPPGGAIMTIANFAENMVLDTIFGRLQTPTPAWVKANWWMQLTSSVPTDGVDGTALLIRVQVPNTSANYPAASGGIKSNGLAISFGATTGQNTLPVATGWEIWDAQTGGNRIWWGTLRIPFAVADRRLVNIPAGAMRIALD